jgi:hypothetical protein
MRVVVSAAPLTIKHNLYNLNRFAEETCDVVNPHVLRVTKLEGSHDKRSRAKKANEHLHVHTAD